jgi:hypothetical protein
MIIKFESIGAMANLTKTITSAGQRVVDYILIK